MKEGISMSDNLLGNIGEKPTFVTPEMVIEKSEQLFGKILDDIRLERKLWSIVDPTNQELKLINKVFKELIKVMLQEKFGNMFVHVDMSNFFFKLNEIKMKYQKESFFVMLKYLYFALREDDFEELIAIMFNSLFKSEKSYKEFTDILDKYQEANFVNIDDKMVDTLLLGCLIEKYGIEILTITEEDYYKLKNDGRLGVKTSVNILDGTISLQAIRKEDIKE